MSDLRDLYQEVILDHNKNPRNFGVLDQPDRRAEGNNPLCGDQLRVTLKIDGDVVSDIHFEGSGCAISKSSASLMTESVKGQPAEQVQQLFRTVHALMTGDVAPEEPAELGKLAVFEGVQEYPTRVKCATLAWHTLMAALDADNNVVTTE